MYLLAKRELWVFHSSLFVCVSLLSKELAAAAATTIVVAATVITAAVISPATAAKQNED